MSITHITFSSQNWAEKHHKGFDKIVSVYEQGARRPRFGNRSPGSILYKNIPDQDFYFRPEASYPSTQDITSFLLFCTSASPKSILIHCKMGVARSAALAAILLAYLQPNISTETIFRSLPNYRAGRPNDVYPTRTLLAPAQEAIQRPDLLSNAYRTFKSAIGYDRMKLHANLAGLPPIETANLLSRRLKENPGLAPFFVSQRYIAETSL